MSTLIDFIHDDEKRKSLALPTPVSTMERSLVVSLEDADVPEANALKFAKDLVKIIASDAFLKELSNEIREPGLTESEDAFVARSKAAMIKLMERHLG